MATRRITVTIPSDLVDAADARAEELDRSRSWVVSDALRQSVSGRPDVASPARAVRERSVPYSIGLGDYRHSQLRDDLKLSPEERVREAERTARVGELVRRPTCGDRVIAFHRYEDYIEWQRREDCRS